MISGFMVVKDVLKTGYPFIEAIASALPLCDEFIIFEGYSNDGTYEVVRRISELNKKVRVFRQEWPQERRITVLADVTNLARAKCSYDYIFSIQANEIVHENSVKFIKALPEICPEVQTFSLPFLQLMNNYKFAEEYRLRLSKNLPSIVAIGDAWSLGSSRNFVRAKALRGLKTPRKLFRYISRGIQWTYANSCGNLLSRAIYLPRPIFRYWSLFPRNFIEKCLQHREMFGLSNFNEVITTLKERIDDNDSDPQSFWKVAVGLFRKGPLGLKYPEGLGEINNQDHPRIMQDLISCSELKSYYVRQELFDLIPGL